METQPIYYGTSIPISRQDEESQISKCDSNSKSHSVWWTLCVDIPLLILVAIFTGLFELNIIPGNKAGFFCNDQKLHYPYTGDTVSAPFLVTSLLLMPLIVIVATELIFLDSYYLQCPRIYQAARNCLWLYRIYAYGLFFNLGIVEVMKGISGSPRPDFFEVCEPDTAKTCNGSEYVRTFQCKSNFSAWMQMDSYRSFPSGHTSLAVYCGFFIAWYLQCRAFDWRHRTVFLVPVLQLAFASYAAVCSLTRVTDFRHHWWDVAFGAVVGVISLLFTVLVLSKNFAYVSPKRTSEVNRVCEQIQRQDIVVSF